MFNQYSNKEVKCPKCHQKVKLILKLNRIKSELIGAKYTGTDKTYLRICPNCKSVIGKE